MLRRLMDRMPANDGHPVAVALMRTIGSMPLVSCDDRDAGAMVLLLTFMLAMPGSAAETVLEAMPQSTSKVVMRRPVMSAMQADGELIVMTADAKMQPVMTTNQVFSVAKAVMEPMPLDRVMPPYVMPVVVAQADVQPMASMMPVSVASMLPGRRDRRRQKHRGESGCQRQNETRPSLGNSCSAPHGASPYPPTLIKSRHWRERRRPAFHSRDFPGTLRERSRRSGGGLDQKIQRPGWLVLVNAIGVGRLLSHGRWRAGSAAHG